jgi:hypothetical protein
MPDAHSSGDVAIRPLFFKQYPKRHSVDESHRVLFGIQTPPSQDRQAKAWRSESRRKKRSFKLPRKVCCRCISGEVSAEITKSTFGCPGAVPETAKHPQLTRGGVKPHCWSRSGPGLGERTSHTWAAIFSGDIDRAVASSDPCPSVIIRSIYPEITQISWSRTRGREMQHKQQSRLNPTSNGT